MTGPLSARLDRMVESLPRAYPGPGGAIAALRDGEVLLRHAWGWANAERRIPFTPHTLFRMCSITKQFTCAAVLDAFPDPSVLDDDVRARLPLPGAAGAGRAASVPQPVRPARLLGGGDAARLAGRGAVRRHRGRPRDRRHAHAALRARHPPLLRQPEFPHPVGHRAGAHRPQLRRAAAHAASSSAPAWQARSWPPTRAPCQTAPRATRARRPAASAPRRTASCGPAMPASAPASTT